VRVEAVLDVIVFRGGALLELAPCYVVIREQQAVRAHERARASVGKPYGGQLKMIEPWLRRNELVFVLKLLGR
jgi:hypothetical protein